MKKQFSKLCIGCYETKLTELTQINFYHLFFYSSSARGLDIPSIRTVVNYDVARDIDTHTHRIGRTGRAGEKGVAYTLLTNKDTTFAGDLVRNLEGANQAVSKELMDLAMQVRSMTEKIGKATTIANSPKHFGFVVCGKTLFSMHFCHRIHGLGNPGSRVVKERS